MSHACTRLVRAFTIYTAFDEPLFWGPILILAIQKLGHMPLEEIYYMESAVVVLCTLLDAPFGALADVIGRKKVVIAGQAMECAGAILFAFITSPLDVWVANVTIMVGGVLKSGADSSLLHDALTDSGETASFRRTLGRAHSMRLYLTAATTLAAGALADIDLRLPLILSIPFIAIPLVTALFYFEDRGVRTNAYGISKQWDVLREGLTHLRNTPALRWIVAFSAFITASSMLWFFTYNSYFDAVGISLTLVGVIFSLINIIAGLASRYVHEIEEKVGERAIVVIMVLCLGPMILVMGLIPHGWSATLVTMQNITRGASVPFMSDFANRHVGPRIRATVSSLQSTVSRMIYAVTLAIFGGVIGEVGLFNALIVLGIVSLAVGLYMIRWHRRLVP